MLGDTVTVKMVEYVGKTIRNREYARCYYKDSEKAVVIDERHQQQAGPLGHHHCVEQGDADGHVVVIGYHSHMKISITMKTTNPPSWFAAGIVQIGFIIC